MAFAKGKEDFDTCIKLRKKREILAARRDNIDVIYETSRYEKMILLREPNYVNEENLNLEKREKAIPEDIKNKIKDELFKRPNEKYSFPLTQSQEIGWDVCQNLNTGKRRAAPRKNSVL